MYAQSTAMRPVLVGEGKNEVILADSYPTNLASKYSNTTIGLSASDGLTMSALLVGHVRGHMASDLPMPDAWRACIPREKTQLEMGEFAFAE